ncbi:RNA binding protein, putative [Babesia bigemina]|uniref:RNA binding protein, putative n=1 Tax=Babesia bigemina TaxID=5866 RepID=A0A061D1C4_BABBI|nr:RNA binding protein, putative [Babesia bigemina]CDR94606.1 RNA binding protein, putative [Babesia bigemina]|eukprot:XP_012766792.1 RNA binding protein, putative [Babesia bigemina]
MEVEGLDSAALKAILMRIDNFEGEFDFLNPAYKCRVVFKGIAFHSVAHGLRFLRLSHNIDGQEYHYDGSDHLPAHVANHVSSMDVSATSEGSDENPLWSAHRHEWLELLLRDKYRRNGDIRTRLGKTGDRQIVFTSTDLFLGFDGKSGQNKVGRITEQIREDMSAYKDHRVWLLMCQNMSAEDFWVTVEESHGDSGICKHRLEGKCLYDIGRIPSCDLKPANPSISRVHASIYMNKRGHVCMVNYNDVTGVTVNGQRLEPHEPFAMRNGDRFTLGASKRVYRISIDRDLVSRKMAEIASKRRELQHKADLHAKRVSNELETFLKGHDEVVVLNVSYKTKRADLYDFFSSCGDVESIQLPQNRGSSDDPASDETLARRGIAFIKFRDKKGAARALERDGMYLNYRKIQVKYKSEDKVMTVQDRAQGVEVAAEVHQGIDAAAPIPAATAGVGALVGLETISGEAVHIPVEVEIQPQDVIWSATLLQCKLCFR